MADKLPDTLDHKPNKAGEKEFERASNVDNDEKDSLIIDDGVGSAVNAPLKGSGDTQEASRKSRG